MKATTRRVSARSLFSVSGWLCALGLTWAMTPAGVCGQDLVVVLSSDADAASADKLAELIREPFQRVAASSLTVPQPAAAAGCRTAARLELSLDSVGQAVRLQRCRDATVLARGLDPEAVRQTPYLSAFVAAELLAINRELEAVEARAVTREEAPPSVAVTPQPSSGNSASPAADGGEANTSTPAEPEPQGPFGVHARAGAELTLWGAPFDHAVRPSLGLGMTLVPTDAPLALLLELSAGLFALAEETRVNETLSLQRHDGSVHAGVRVPLGPLQLAGFALARASLTRAAYRTDIPQTTNSRVRYGLGIGAQAEMRLVARLSLYLQVKLDVATSQSQYRVATRELLRDPLTLLWVGLGLSLRLLP
jgi:hypothetical protein